MTDTIGAIGARVTACSACPRLVEWREAAAADPPARFRGQQYWARPVPGFGDPAARLLVVGLAPAAHGGNRTGRMFTGDRSGDWLFRGLHRSGFANQALSAHQDDGLRLTDCYVTAVVRCAPPANKPSTTERDTCLPFLVDEMAALTRLRVIVALGGFAWKGVMRALKAFGSPAGVPVPTPAPAPAPASAFGHGVIVDAGGYKVIGSFHPSQQNTFTGKLTEKAFDSVFTSARELLNPDI